MGRCIEDQLMNTVASLSDRVSGVVIDTRFGNVTVAEVNTFSRTDKLGSRQEVRGVNLQFQSVERVQLEMFGIERIYDDCIFVESSSAPFKIVIRLTYFYYCRVEERPLIA